MTNNTPDYNDNLAFEPKMTWEELKEWAKKFTKERGIYFAEIGCGELIEIGNLYFYAWGDIECSTCDEKVVKGRTQEQMKTIIEALYE